MKHLDGWLYVGVAVCTAITAAFNTDDAVEYLQPETLFYTKTIFGALAAGLLAGKMYRSTTFANGQPPVPPIPPPVQPPETAQPKTP